MSSTTSKEATATEEQSDVVDDIEEQTNKNNEEESDSQNKNFDPDDNHDDDSLSVSGSDDLHKKGRCHRRRCCGCCSCRTGWTICSFFIAFAFLFLFALALWAHEDYPYEEIASTLTPNSTDEEIRQAIQEMADYYHANQCPAGSVIGVSRRRRNEEEDGHPAGRQQVYVSSGVLMVGEEDNPVTKDTLFEIASISKPMTGLVLAHEIVKGELSLNTTLSSLLPDSVPDFKTQDGNLVTLRQLVTHTSGFPRLPKVIRSMPVRSNFERENPYKGFDEEDMLEQLTIASKELGDTDLTYSNFAFSTLAYVMARHRGTTYPDLQTALTSSLGLSSTFLETIPESHLPQLSTGYRAGNRALQEAYWYDGGLFINGGGSTVSSARDLLTWLELLMDVGLNSTTSGSNNSSGLQGNDTSMLQQALKMSITPLTSQNAFAWFFEDDDDDNSKPNSSLRFDHTGLTAGFSSIATFQPSSETGVVGLSNCGINSAFYYISCSIAYYIFHSSCFSNGINHITEAVADRLFVD